MKTIYDENKDVEYQTYLQKSEKLLREYADKDEKGEPVLENNSYKITKQIENYKTESSKLLEEYSKTLEDRQRKINESIKFLELPAEHNVIMMPVNKFPDKTMPAIVGIFGI